jgi:hypothetical protein
LTLFIPDSYVLKRSSPGVETELIIDQDSPVWALILYLLPGRCIGLQKYSGVKRRAELTSAGMKAGGID